MASWYGGKFQGRKTANGEIFDTRKFTAAHRNLAFDTKVRVTNLDNGRSTVVRINDRGPFIQGRIIDLSQAAAEALDMIHSGTARVRIEVLGTDAEEVKRQPEPNRPAAADRPPAAIQRNEPPRQPVPVELSGVETAGGFETGSGNPAPMVTANSVHSSGPRNADPLASIPLPEPELPEVISFSETASRRSARSADGPSVMGPSGTGPSPREESAAKGSGNRAVPPRSPVPKSSETMIVRHYTIQVGSFALLDNAVRMKEYLETRGFNPRFEAASGGITRVILPNIVPVRLGDTTEKLKNIGIMEYLVREVR